MELLDLLLETRMARQVKFPHLRAGPTRPTRREAEENMTPK